MSESKRAALYSSCLEFEFSFSRSSKSAFCLTLTEIDERVNCLCFLSEIFGVSDLAGSSTKKREHHVLWTGKNKILGTIKVEENLWQITYNCYPKFFGELQISFGVFSQRLQHHWQIFW